MYLAQPIWYANNSGYIIYETNEEEEFQENPPGHRQLFFKEFIVTQINGELQYKLNNEKIFGSFEKTYIRNLYPGTLFLFGIYVDNLEWNYWASKVGIKANILSDWG